MVSTQALSCNFTHCASANVLYLRQHIGTSFSKPFSSVNQSSPRRTKAAQTHQINGTSHSYNNSSFSEAVGQGGSIEPFNQSRAIPNVDPSYLTPYPNGGLRPALTLSRSGSEPDSLLDLYGRPRSGAESMDKVERPLAMEDGYIEDEDPERSRWIHRDKLLVIESQEMQEAGIKLPPPGRSNSKPQGRREHSRDQHSNSLRNHNPDVLNGREVHNQRFEEPLQQQEQTEEDPSNYDLRTLEEIAADPHPAFSPHMYRQTGLRSSSSRIPLPRDSPLPIPQEHIERSTPIPRKRGASANWSSGDENVMAYGKVRRRSQSVGSLVLLDDGDHLHSSPTPAATHPGSPNSVSISPTKPRVVGNSGLSSGSRRTSNPQRDIVDAQNPRSPPKPRITSGQRPKSRAGLEPRPATAINRPEGDPPWLATMFKPDPRLPPEQQLLPTHAKKLQEEQQNREKERRIVLEARKEFTPLAVHTQRGLQPPSPARSLQDEGEKGKENEPGWPLKVMSKSSKSNESPTDTSLSPNAGYSTIPRMHGTPQMSRAPSPKPMPQAMELKESPKGKSCGCCVVM